MKRTLLILAVSLLPFCALSKAPATRIQSGATFQRRLEVRVKPFIDLYFFVYRVSSGSARPPEIDGFAQAVEAAREAPFGAMFTQGDLNPFRCESAADAVQAFSKYPETYKTRQGEIIPLRERALRLARSLAVIEKPFLEKVWPQHKVVIDQAAARIAETLGPREHEVFSYLTNSLGMEDARRVVPLYLVAEAPWPGGWTIWGDNREGLCVISVAANEGSALFISVVHEAIHALDLETKGKSNVLSQLRDRLLKAGFAEDDPIVQHGPHMLVFIQTAETVRRKLDSSYQPHAESVLAREGLQPIVKVELPIWTAYLDGKLSREDAVNQIIEGFVKARSKAAPAKVQP